MGIFSGWVMSGYFDYQCFFLIHRSEDDSEEHLGQVQQRSADGYHGTLGGWQVHTDGHCGRIQVRGCCCLCN